MGAEFHAGKIFLGEYECSPRTDVPGVIADFFLKFQMLGWEEKETVLKNVDYDEVLESDQFEVSRPMTTHEYELYLDRRLLIAILDNESTLLRLRDMEDQLRHM
jgi:hypothetical protein